MNASLPTGTRAVGAPVAGLARREPRRTGEAGLPTVSGTPAAIKRFHHRLARTFMVLGQLLLCFAVPSAAAQPTDPAELDLTLAREEAVVVTNSDRIFRGLLDGVREGRMFIRRITEGGEVGYSFTAEEVSEFTVPGARLASEAIDLWERREIEDALPLLEAIGRQRLRYLPWLNREQRRPLFALIAAQIEAGDPRAAIAYVSLLRSHTTTVAEATELRDAELTAYDRLGLTAETRALALAWCRAADAAEGSALGWRILAQLDYDAANYERALWTALQPIIFSTYLPLEDLDRCYALAIAGADALGDRATAWRLYREMNERAIDWPDDARFNDVALRYAALTASPEPDDALLSDREPATAETRAAVLTFDGIRKLVASPGWTSP